MNPETTSFLGQAHTAASAVYFKDGPPGEKQLPEGWSRVPLPDKPGLAEDMRKADCEYLQSPSGKRFVSFRGTAELADWKANAANGLGMHSVKYDAAARIGEAFRDVSPEVAFTGHSLGGGLAKLAAEAASKDSESKTVVAFNAASVSPGTYRNHDLPTQDHQRTTIHVVNEHDILNRALKGGKISAFGGDTLADREHLPTSMIVLAKGSGSAVGASGHGIRNFVPMGDTASGEHLTAPLFKSNGESVQPEFYDRFKPLPPVPSQTAAILEAARSVPQHGLAQAHDLGGHQR